MATDIAEPTSVHEFIPGAPRPLKTYVPFNPTDHDGVRRDAPWATPLSARGEPPLDPSIVSHSKRHADHQYRSDMAHLITGSKAAPLAKRYQRRHFQQGPLWDVGGSILAPPQYTDAERDAMKPPPREYVPPVWAQEHHLPPIAERRNNVSHNPHHNPAGVAPWAVDREPPEPGLSVVQNTSLLHAERRRPEPDRGGRY